MEANTLDEPYQRGEDDANNAHDELLAALTECAAIVRLQNGNLHDDINGILERAEAAIARATGE